MALVVLKKQATTTLRESTCNEQMIAQTLEFQQIKLGKI